MKKSIIITFMVLLASVSFAKASQHPNDINNLQTLGGLSCGVPRTAVNEKCGLKGEACQKKRIE